MAKRQKARGGVRPPRQGPPNAAAATDCLNIEEWLAFHRASHKKYALDAHPGAVALLQRMLGALEVTDPVSWTRVSRYVRRTWPEAPKSPDTYCKYATDRLGWDGISAS